jgi:hypothetical protein
MSQITNKFILGAIPINKGGTGQTTASAAFAALSPLTTVGDIIYEDATPLPVRLAIGSTGQVLTVVAGLPSWQSPATSGTVTSVALADSTGLFNITGSPVTSSGTLTLASFQSQAQHSFFAAPSGSSGAPTFRAIVASDVPTLNQNTTGTASNVTGTVAIANGGTGQTTAASAFAALSPLTTAGDIIYENNTPAPARLPIGSSGQVLTVSGGLPSWQTPGGGGSGLTAFWSGYHDGTFVWGVTSSSFSDPGTVNKADATHFVEEVNVGFGTVISANDGTVNHDLPGINFTPVDGAYYQITANIAGVDVFNNGEAAAFRFSDGTVTFGGLEISTANGGNNEFRPLTITGIYNPGSPGGAVNLRLQAKVSANEVDWGSTDAYGNSIQWTIMRIS